MLLIECVLLYLLLQRTTLGLKIRAVASNPESSRLLGINAGFMLMFGWALSASLGALAGSLVAAERTGFDASLMQSVLVYAFAAAALGGFDSPLGAVLSGVVVGVADTLTKEYINAARRHRDPRAARPDPGRAAREADRPVRTPDRGAGLMAGAAAW